MDRQRCQLLFVRYPIPPYYRTSERSDQIQLLPVMATKDLGSACSSAYAMFPGNCSGEVREIARRMGYVLPEGNANFLIDYLSISPEWQSVDEVTAIERAGRQILVIAGKKESRNGHVVVVLPGEARMPWLSTVKYPGSKHNPSPVACSTSMRNREGARSRGEKTVVDAWGKMDGVKYRAHMDP